jgi:hypothetical protein
MNRSISIFIRSLRFELSSRVVRGTDLFLANMAGQNVRGNRGSEGVDYSTFAEIKPIGVPLVSSLRRHARNRVSQLEYGQFC